MHDPKMYFILSNIGEKVLNFFYLVKSGLRSQNQKQPIRELLPQPMRVQIAVLPGRAINSISE